MAAISGLDLTGIARSLLNIEVNTIICQGMTAEQMPPLPHAVLDVAGWYADTLCKAGIDLRPYFEHAAAEAETLPVQWSDSPSFSSDELIFSADTFERLRWAAKNAGDSGAGRKGRLAGSDRVMFHRIVNNCDTIKAMFKRFGPDIMGQFGAKARAAITNDVITKSSYFIAPDDIVALQKIWDLGTDEIVAQTIVYLNGNVTTRILDPTDNGAAAQILSGIHRQSVDVSLGAWHFLLQAIQEIAGTAVNALFGRRP